MEIFNWVGKNALLFKMVSLFVINDNVLVFYFHYSLPVEGINFTQLKTFSKGTKWCRAASDSPGLLCAPLVKVIAHLCPKQNIFPLFI